MTPRTAWRRLRRRLRPRRPPHAASSATGTTPAGDRLIRWSTIAVVVTVAVFAAYVSYRHAYELVRSHGEAGASARVVPLTVDGLIYASSMVLLQAARLRQPAPWLAHAALWTGIAATGGANVAHGIGHGWVGALVSAWPAVALIGSYELLMKMIRAGATRGADPLERHDDPAEDHCPHGVAESAEQAVQIAYLHGRDCLGDKPSQRHLERQFGVDRKRVAALVHEVDPDARRARAPQPPSAPDPAMNGAGGR